MKTYLGLIAFSIVGVTLVVGAEISNKASDLVPNSKRAAVGILHSTNSSISDVQNALITLKGFYISPEVFLQIANDVSYLPEIRRECILELFRRHAPTECRLLELRNFVKGCASLRREDIKAADSVTGMLPIVSHVDDSVFYIHLLPKLGGRTAVIYFRVIGRIDVNTVADQLFGFQSIHGVEKLRVSGVVPWSQ